jgi:hypothetical protein
MTPYYDTIEEDLKAAKEILAEGSSALDGTLTINGHEIRTSGGTIFGKDIYAAYKLLESFIAEIERLQLPVKFLHEVAVALTVHIRRAPTCLNFRPDHNGECLECDDWWDEHDPAGTYCSQAGESMSLEFWLDHVVPNREDCCRELYKRLCPECATFIQSRCGPGEPIDE